MQPTALDIQRQGDLGGEKILTRFDEDSIEFIMSVLTDLYSDPELAVIREYSTNAFDSHVDAGQTRPIEVTTPSSLSPYFKVKDYGLGMSVDDIRKTYSAYGASTKRDSNTVVGMLGLGSKSAWTYTAQFTVVAVKGGVKTTVAATRTETGRTMLEIVDTCGTTEPNSVEIIVPVRSGNSFETKARDFFRFWKPGTVLLNGQEPERITGDKVGDRMIIVPDLDSDYVVMGNVAYPVEYRRLYPGSYRTWGIVATVNIGDVSFTPSREALNYNAHTKATIQALADEFAAEIRQTITDEISGAKSHAEAVSRLSVWKERFPSLTSGVTYKGVEVPTFWDVSRYISWRTNWSRHAVNNNERRIGIESLDKGLSITNFPSDSLSGYQRAKVRKWAEDNNVTLPDRVYLFSDALPGSPWTDNVRTVDWTVIKAIKMSDGTTVRKASSGLRFSVVDKRGGYRDTDELDTELEILYFSPADYDRYSVSRTMLDLADEVQVVLLGKNRWDKFLRDFPTAQPLDKWLRERVRRAVAALTDEDKTLLAMPEYTRRHLAALDPDRIDDPAVVEAVRLARRDTDTETVKAFKAANNRARVAINASDASAGGSFENPLEPYVLLRLGYGKSYDAHNYAYMNAYYHAEIAPKAIDDESAA